MFRVREDEPQPVGATLDRTLRVVMIGTCADHASSWNEAKEQVSAVGKRQQLETAIDFIRQGDVLVVTKLCRLARSTQHLLEIADRVQLKGAALHILDLG